MLYSALFPRGEDGNVRGFGVPPPPPLFQWAAEKVLFCSACDARWVMASYRRVMKKNTTSRSAPVCGPLVKSVMRF